MLRHNRGVQRTALTMLTLIALAACNREAETRTGNQEETMTAQGTFDVKVIPQPADAPEAGPFGRLFLDQQFHGALEGSSKGTMLGTQNEADGSGGYVALELVTGTLNGKRGSFVLQHNGTMSGGAYTMNVNVVPGSGTGELAGISGRMTIIIEGKEHRYDFAYLLGTS